MQTRILTFYRFIAASVVVIFHFGQGTILYSLAPGFFNSGPEMVTFFFVLSGFIMALTCFDQIHFSYKRYWLNRFSKIYPTYLLAAIIMMLFFGQKDNANNPRAILLHLTLLQSWVPGYPLTVNVPAWSLSIEAFFYALFPGILYLIKKHKPTANHFVAIALGLWAITQLLHIYLLNSATFIEHKGLVQFLVLYFPLSHLSSFILGIAGYYLLDEGRHLKQRNTFFKDRNVADNLLAVTLVCVFLVLTFKSDISHKLGLILPFESSLLSPLFLLLIMISVQCENGFTRLFSFPFFIRLGEASYAIYILQKPVRSLYQMYVYPTINTTLHIHLSRDIHFIMYFVLLVAVSIWITLRIETPVKALLRKTTVQPT